MNYTVVIIDANYQHKEYHFEKYENAKSFIDSLSQYGTVVKYPDLQIILFDKDWYIIDE